MQSRPWRVVQCSKSVRWDSHRKVRNTKAPTTATATVLRERTALSRGVGVGVSQKATATRPVFVDGFGVSPEATAAEHQGIAGGRSGTLSTSRHPESFRVGCAWEAQVKRAAGSALRPLLLPDGLALDRFPTPDPCGGADAKRRSAAPGTRCLDGSHSFVASIFAVRNMSRRPFPPRIYLVHHLASKGTNNLHYTKGKLRLPRSLVAVLGAEGNSKDTRRASGQTPRGALPRSTGAPGDSHCVPLLRQPG